MRRIWKAVPLVLFAAVLFAGCSQPTAEPAVEAPAAEEPAVEEPATAAPLPEPTDSGPELIAFTDGFGRDVVLQEPAKRIISMAPSNTEVVFAIGAGDLLVGRDDFSDYPEEALEVASVGDIYAGLNIEAIVGLNPDLVLAADITPPEQIAALEDVGLTVFAVGNPREFEDLFGNIELIGVLTGRTVEADALADELRATYAQIIEATAKVEPVSVFYEVDGSDQNAPWTTGTGTFQQTVFDLIGGDNRAADIQGWGQLSLEEIVLRDPQVIVFGSGPFVPTTVENLVARPGWGELTAVSQGRVFGINTDLVDLPGPRLVEGLRQLAEMLHPELFDG